MQPETVFFHSKILDSIIFEYLSHNRPEVEKKHLIASLKIYAIKF